jgi:hypothetical protein
MEISPRKDKNKGDFFNTLNPFTERNSNKSSRKSKMNSTFHFIPSTSRG